MKRFLPVFKRNSDSNRIIQGHATECLNAYVIPQTLGTDFGCGESSFIHGVFLPSSELPDHFYHNRKHGPLINQRLRQRYLDDNLTADVPVVSGKWLYAGGLFEHFGHFLVESVHRLWAKSEFDVEGIVFACKPNIREPSALPSYLLEVLKIFDVPVEKIHFVKSLTRFEHLIVPEQGTVLNGLPKPWYEPFLQRIQNQIADFKRQSHQKIWLSRRAFLQAGRVLGLDYFLELMTENGFTEFNPEQHSLVEQLSVVLNAKQIIWEEGSSLHLLDVLKQLDSRNVLISRRPHHKAFENLIRHKASDNTVFDMVTCLPDFRREDDQLHSAVSVLNSPIQFYEFLQAEGFISGKNNTFDKVAFISREQQDIINFIRQAPNNDISSDSIRKFLDSYTALRQLQ